jgi:DNA-directed RNA polymerase specialized sigma24 family protein
MSRKTEKTINEKTAKRRESHCWKPLEPVLQMLKHEVQHDDASCNSKVAEDAIKTLRPQLMETAACYFGGCCGMIDCDPEEAAQDMLLLLPLLFEMYPERKPFFPTLLTTLRRYCCSKMRRASVRRVVELPPEVGHKGESHVDLIISAETREIDRRQVHRAWDDLTRSGVLTRNERRALKDFYWKGESSKESSRHRGITPGRINAERHSGRVKLRQALQERGFRRH